MWTVGTGMVQLKGRDYSLDSWGGFHSSWQYGIFCWLPTPNSFCRPSSVLSSVQLHLGMMLSPTLVQCLD